MEKCYKCGAEKVLNPKTGKMFCKDKCWLRGQTSQPSQPQEQNGWAVVVEHLTALEAKVDGMMDLLREQLGS